jgi:hypothetical protein
LLLFGGKIEIDVHGGGILVDGWVRMRGWARIGVLVGRLRGVVDGVLRRRIENPFQGGGVRAADWDGIGSDEGTAAGGRSRGGPKESVKGTAGELERGDDTNGSANGPNRGNTNGERGNTNGAMNQPASLATKADCTDAAIWKEEERILALVRKLVEMNGQDR